MFPNAPEGDARARASAPAGTSLARRTHRTGAAAREAVHDLQQEQQPQRRVEQGLDHLIPLEDSEEGLAEERQSVLGPDARIEAPAGRSTCSGGQSGSRARARPCGCASPRASTWRASASPGASTAGGESGEDERVPWQKGREAGAKLTMTNAPQKTVRILQSRTARRESVSQRGRAGRAGGAHPSIMKSTCQLLMAGLSTNETPYASRPPTILMRERKGGQRG